MANAAQKKLAASNQRIIKNHRIAWLIVNITFILVRFVWRFENTYRPVYIMYMLSFTLAGWLQLQLERFGMPTYDSRGQLVTPGDNLSQQGMMELFFDGIYLTWGIQLLVAFTTVYAFWLYLLAPAYFAWWAWSTYQTQMAKQPQQQVQEQSPPEKQGRSQRRAAARR